MTPDQIGEYLEHQGATDEEIDAFLEHFGVKGMKWGQRKAARQRNRELNKASRAKDKAKYVSSIEKSRANINSGKTDAAFKAVKAGHSQRKKDLGTREARKILAKARNKRDTEYAVAQQAKNGKEATAILIASVAGSILVSKLVSG